MATASCRGGLALKYLSIKHRVVKSSTQLGERAPALGSDLVCTDAGGYAGVDMKICRKLLYLFARCQFGKFPLATPQQGRPGEIVGLRFCAIFIIIALELNDTLAPRV